MSLYSPARNNYILKLPRTLSRFTFSCKIIFRFPSRIPSGTGAYWREPFFRVNERHSFFAATNSNGQEITKLAYKPSDTSWFEIDLADPSTCLKILTNYNELPETDAVAIQNVLNSLLQTVPEDVNKRADRVREMMLQLEDHHEKN